MHNEESFTPSYLKIQNYVYAKIKSGEYLVGDKIPSEIELAKQFGVSRITANKAIKEMSLTGILERVRGKGTFVCATQNIPTASKAFVSAVKMNVTGARHHQLLQFRIVEVTGALAEKTQMPEGTPFYEIISANKYAESEQNESLDYTYIPCSLIANITPSLDYLGSHFVFDYLRNLPNVHPKFLKIFVSTPQYPFLDSAIERLGNPKNTSIWCTEVYDGTMVLLANTFTVYPSSSQDIPLFTFTL